MKKWLSLFFICPFLLAVTSCYRMRSSHGGGQISSISSRKINTSDIALPPGYKIEAVVSGLTFPTAVAFDDEQRAYVIEAGYSYGEVFGEPKLLRIEPGGTTTQIAKGANNGPWTGITFYKGAFYVAEGGEREGGKILRINMDGSIKELIANLPSVGDHHTNGPVIKDGYIYFGQGTATNSSVVGPDNKEFGWLMRKKDFHDIPCADIVLNGINFTSENVLAEGSKGEATTGAYSPFNQSTIPGEIKKGSIPCTGSILRIPIDGGAPELVAWGFRNPFGLALNEQGRLYITENGYDDRGSRPVWGAGDVLWEVRPGLWYGWPDYSAGKSIIDDEEFKVPGKDPVKAILQIQPNKPPKPVAIFGVHSSSNGFDFCTNAAFGYAGEAFVAQFGDMAPKAGKVLAPVGFKVVRVNINSGVIQDFAVNKGRKNGPATRFKRGGLERPVSVKFDPSGKAMYIADFGIMRLTKKSVQPQVKTGVIWKITKEGS